MTYPSLRFDPRQSASAWLVRLWGAPLTPSPFNPLHAVLWLACGGYRIGLALDQWLKRNRQCRLPVPILSVGNLVVGGTGKTPFTLWLAETLTRAGMAVAVLSRGYGRKADGVARVRETHPTGDRAALLFGDEPVLLARRLPSVAVWVGRERAAAGMRAIEEDCPSVVILDDGFQHLSLGRDVDFVLLDARRPFGNGRLLPLGPMREPVHHLSRAGALVLTRADDHASTFETRAALEKRFRDKPVFSCRHRISGMVPGPGSPPLPAAQWKGRVAVAFAGIARPESFFESVRSDCPELRLAETLAFPDHHVYTNTDCERVLRAAEHHKADRLITTEKDWVRLPQPLQGRVLVAAMELDFGADLGRLTTYLLRQIETVRSSGRDKSERCAASPRDREKHP